MAARRKRTRPQARGQRDRLLQPQRDLPKPEQDVARSAIDLVEDLSTRYEPGEAAQFIRDLHNELVDLWQQLEGQSEPRDREASKPRAWPDELNGVLGDPLPRAERIAMMERDLTRRFERRRQLRSESFTAPQVAELLGVSRQTLYDRHKAGRLLAVRLDNNLLFPIWQFDADQPDGVLPDFPRVVDALNHLSSLAKYAWFTSPKPAFDNETPVELLMKRQGEIVVQMARGAGVA